MLIEELFSAVYLCSSISFDVFLSTLTPEQYQQAHCRLEYDETNSGTTQTSVPWRGAASEPPSRSSHLLATLVLKLWGLNGVNSLFYFFL